MNRIYTFIAIFLFLCKGHSQNLIGFATGNYGGTNHMYLNPAMLGDNRYYFFMNLGGGNINFINNYVELKTPYRFPQLIKAALKGQNTDSVAGFKGFDDSYIVENVNGRSKYFNLSTEVRGPSFLLAWNRKNTIAAGVRQRFAIQLNDVAEPFARLMRYGFDKPQSKQFFNQIQTDNAFGLQIGTYLEYSLSYSREILNVRRHYLKGGITVKKLYGQGALFIQNKGVQVNFINKDSLWAIQSDLAYGGVREQYYGIQDPNNSSNMQASDLWPTSKLGSGWGYDFGFVYEYRPDYKTYESKLNGKKWIDNKKNKYELRVSFAITDIGKIHYNDPKWIYYHELKGRNISLNDTAFWGQLNKLNVSNTRNIDSAVGFVFGFKNSASEFNWVLPTAFNIAVDYKLKKNLYVGAIWLQGVRKVNAAGFRTNSLLSIIPRFESKWIDVSMPLTLMQNYNKFNLGLYLRLGPVYIGSDNIGGYFGLSSINGFDFYAGTSVPLYRSRIKDRDKDGVTDNLDRCVRVPGSWEMRGCPDQDSDMVEDTKDRCPTVKGDPKLQGCPDKDGDGIPDDKDACPEYAGAGDKKGCPDLDGDGVYDPYDECKDQFGKVELKGCPDRDGDGVKDMDDKCPDLKGMLENKGCPDLDGDGINDNEDKCPDKYGPPRNQGCPDSDGDGFDDKDDECPEVPGLAKFKGCPDRDLDNVPDKLDKCPDTYGDPLNDGCPLVLPEKIDTNQKVATLNTDQQNVLLNAFSNLEFASGKSAINNTSKPNLDKLADLMKKNPKFKLIISGHTDNVGKPEANLKLSRDRASEVRRYLIFKGVKPIQVKAEGFGDTQPVSVNDTEEGRQRNRRVELKIIE